MIKKAFIFSFSLMFVLAATLYAHAQLPDASSASGRPDPSRQTDLPTGIKETLAKQRIKNEEKEYQELINRVEEAARIGDELDKSLEVAQNFSSADVKKLDRLEKVVKKIREDLGAKDEGEEKTEAPATENHSSLRTAVKNIKEDAASLLSEVKKRGRHTVSVVAIESSNALLKLVRFLRFNKK